MPKATKHDKHDLLPWRAPTYKPSQAFDLDALQDHMTN